MLFHSGQGASYFGKNINDVTVVNNLLYLNHGGSLLMPNGIEAGDLLIVANTAGAGSSSTPTITVTPGLNFTLISSSTGTYTVSTFFYRQTSAMSYKIAVGTEGGTTISSFMSSNGNAAILFHLRGNVKIGSVTNIVTNSSFTAGDPPLTTITTTNAFEIPYYMNGTSNSAPTVSVTPAVLASNSGAGGVYSGIAAGIWSSKFVASSYIYDSTDGGNMNTFIGGRLILTN